LQKRILVAHLQHPNSFKYFTELNKESIKNYFGCNGNFNKLSTGAGLLMQIGWWSSFFTGCIICI
jgi:hypothetical protein